MSAKKFPSPYNLNAPAGAEGWQSMYPYYLTFRDELRTQEEGKFWFCDSQHWPKPFKPFDAVTVEFAVKCLGQYNTRHYLVPPANGIEYRIHNGYCYMSPVAVAPEKIGDRVPQFMERAGHYFANWGSLLENWNTKVRANIADLEALDFQPLPEVVPLEWVKSGRGLDNTYDLMETYDRSIQLLYKTWQYHFEFLNLGYVAYLDFFGFCKQAFPSISDQGIAKMVQGVDVDLFRPDDELKKLAHLAVNLGLDEVLCAGDCTADTVADLLTRIAAAPRGTEWIAAWEAAQDPWFNFTSGNGFYSDDEYWIEHLHTPLGYVRDYAVRVAKGEKIGRASCRERVS
jgi:pyruvate,water dikinase